MARVKKAQGTQHGILDFLANAPVDRLTGYSLGYRAMEIVKRFPRTRGSSTLTIMHRQGLIQKAGETQTSAWLITAAGRKMLEGIGKYDPKCIRCNATAIPDEDFCQQCMDNDDAKAIDDLKHPDYDDPNVVGRGWKL